MRFDDGLFLRGYSVTRRDDHKVDYRTEETIATIATNWRLADRSWPLAFFDMEHFLHAHLAERLARAVHNRIR